MLARRGPRGYGQEGGGYPSHRPAYDRLQAAGSPRRPRGQGGGPGRESHHSSPCPPPGRLRGLENIYSATVSHWLRALRPGRRRPTGPRLARCAHHRRSSLPPMQASLPRLTRPHSTGRSIYSFPRPPCVVAAAPTFHYSVSHLFMALAAACLISPSVQSLSTSTLCSAHTSYGHKGSSVLPHKSIQHRGSESRFGKHIQFVGGVSARPRAHAADLGRRRPGLSRRVVAAPAARAMLWAELATWSAAACRVWRRMTRAASSEPTRSEISPPPARAAARRGRC